MGKIVAIWGGEIGRPGYPIETIKIDKEIVKFSWKKHPNLLFIPTASWDSEWYVSVASNYFWKKLWCKINILYLINNKPTTKEIEEKILGSDIVYVWGGNTLKMMTLWRKFWVDKVLKKALKKDIVLCWTSAGSICRFRHWNSDSRKFTSDSNQLIKVTWLGLINALHCPHYNVEEQRHEDLKRMTKKYPWVSIAIDNCCAIQIHDDKYRIISSKEWAKAYKIYRKLWKYFKETIPETKEYKLLKDLLRK